MIPNVEEGGQGGSSGLDDEGIKVLLDNARKGFFRKVYGMLACELCVTVLISVWMMLTPSIRHYVINHSLAIYLIAIFPLVGLMIALFILKQQYPLNVSLLFFFVVCFSFLIGIICAHYYEDGYGNAILIGFGITVALLALLTVVAFQNCCSLSMVYEMIITASFVVLISIILHVLAGGWHLSLFVACMSSFVLCLIIVADVHRLVEEVGVDEYIVANVNLFTEVMSLFVSIIQILRFVK